MAEALTRSTQPLRSWYMLFFQLPMVPERALAWSGGSRLVDQLAARTASTPTPPAGTAGRAATPGALTGPLNWYGPCRSTAARRSARSAVPTLFVWGRRDRFVTEVAADRCGRHVTGPFTFVPLAEADHWLPSSWAHWWRRLLLGHLGGTGDDRRAQPGTRRAGPAGRRQPDA